MNALMIADRSIRQDADGRYCVNDLHKASGNEPRNRPAYWLAGDQAKALVAEIEKAGFPAISTKQRVGTFVARELVYAYAMWISPAFHLAVIRSFDAMVSGQRPEDVRRALNDLPTLRALLADQLDERQRLEHRVAEQAPCVAAFERLAGSRGAVSLTAAAKALGIRPRDFTAWLSGARWIYRSHDAGGWLGHARHTDAGHLVHRVLIPEGSVRERVQVLVTKAGLACLAQKLEAAALPTPIHPDALVHYRKEFEP